MYLTFASDLYLFSVVASFKIAPGFEFVPTDVFDAYPALLALYERVKANPTIAAYYARKA